MKKVVRISLAGTAYQVEEQGYEALKSYLDKSERSLGDNPDRPEVLEDIERAIAEKASAKLSTNKDIVTNQEVADILEKIGPVDGGESVDEPVEPVTTGGGRRLFRLPKECKIGGVCAGLAAFFGMDVTLMRLLFVVLLFATQGFMILIYIALLVVVDEAKTPEDVAAAHGRPVTAQEIRDRISSVEPVARSSADKIGSVLTVLMRGLAKISTWLLVASIVVLTGMLVWGLWVTSLGQLQMHGNLAEINEWKIATVIIFIYLIVVAPAYALFRFFDTVAGSKPVGEWMTKSAQLTVVVVTLAAMFSLLSFTSIYGGKIGEYTEKHHGYLDVGKYRLCLDSYSCKDSYYINQDDPS